MVYVGFGIVAASLSVLIYRKRLVLLSRLLAFWRGNHDTRQESLGSPQISKQVPRETDITKAEKEVLILQERVATDHASQSYQLDFELEEPKIRKRTPTPCLTLDDAKSTDEKYASASTGPLLNNIDDLALKMASESTSPPEKLEQKSTKSMPPQTPQ
ncbi:hypothetical protein MMC29_006728, partial [Sticta canariensis]|nr:hypothetical protein [Sticta canariensis]